MARQVREEPAGHEQTGARSEPDARRRRAVSRYNKYGGQEPEVREIKNQEVRVEKDTEVSYFTVLLLSYFMVLLLPYFPVLVLTYFKVFLLQYFINCP